jgi:predicted dehydrogenase
MSQYEQKPPSNSSSRREFLKQSSTVAVSTALAGAVIPRCHASGGSTIHLALVGCGGRGTGAVADAFSTSGGPVKLVAMADLFEPRLKGSLKQLAQSFPNQVDVPPDRQFLGFDAYRRAIDCLGEQDVVLLTTHAAFRPLHFEYAVAKGVNVFAEKSFAVDGPAVRRWLQVADASEQKNLKVGVGFMWRHSRARQAAIARIHDGAIGDVHTLRIYRVHEAVHCPPLPQNANELAFQIQHAARFNWVSGGFFIDWHCHNIDVACWAKNAWPVEAQGMGGRCYPEAGNLLDHYTVEFTFGDGAKLFAFSRHMNHCWNTYSDYLHGSRGSAVLMTDLSQPKPRIYRTQRMLPENLEWEFGRDDPNPYHAEWQVLLDAVRHGKTHNEARRAGEANVAALMGRMATHTGQLITWDQALNSNYRYVADIDQMTFDTAPPIRADAGGFYAAPVPGVTQEV